MSPIQELLTGVFTRHGFEVRDAPTGGLLAVSNGTRVLVKWSHDVVSGNAVQAIADEASRHGAARAILVNLASEDAPAGDERVEVWTRARIAYEVGETVLAYTDANSTTSMTSAAKSSNRIPAKENPREFKSLIARASDASDISRFGAYYLPSKPTRSAEPTGISMLPNAFSGQTGLSAPNASLKRTSRNDAVAMDVTHHRRAPAASASAAPAASAVPAPPTQATTNGAKVAVVRGKEINLEPNEDVEIIISKPKAAPAAPGNESVSTDHPILKPVVSKTVATQQAQNQVGRVKRASMELVPHVAFRYDLNINEEGLTEPVRGNGFVLVNGVSGSLTDLNELAYTEHEMENAQTAFAKFEAADVYGTVRRHLVQKYTRDVRITKVVHDVEMIESRRIVPTPVDLSLEHAGTVLAPVWVIEGEKGNVEIDAFVS